MTTIDENKTVVRHYIDLLFSKGDAEGANQYIAEDFVNHDPPFGATADRDGMRRNLDDDPGGVPELARRALPPRRRG